jgi:hypothetical protein
MYTTSDLIQEVKLVWLVAEDKFDINDVESLINHIAADRLNDPAALEPDWLAGYGAYHRGLGPGPGKLRNLGWLAARRDVAGDLAERQAERW